MWTAIPAQRLPAGNALTVGLNCANPMRQPAARVARSSPVLLVLPSNRALEACARGTSGEKKGLRSYPPALHSIIADAVIFAERILQRIDAEWPAPR